jgi:chromosome segregation protein
VRWRRFKSLAEDPILSDNTILLPHGGNDASHKTIFRAGFHTRYANLEVEGVYATGKISDLKSKTLDKIRGKGHAWGPRRRGLLMTSDSRDASFAQLGECECWIRLGEPTAEAIRQALLADEARVVYEPPHVPSQRVVSLRVSSLLCGHDFTVVFNEGLTCLIGGRGSGKSALLEYLRFGLGRSARDTGESSVRDRERELIEDTLLGSDQVSVTLVRDGSVEVWLRTSDNVDQIRVQHESGEEETITPAEARRRFRGRAYYQKQLSTLVVDAEKASEQITSIAAVEFLDQMRAVDADFEAAKRSVGAAVGRYEEFCVAQAQLNAANASIADIRRRILATEDLLNRAGWSDADRSILSQQPIYDRAHAYLKQVRDERKGTRDTIIDLKNALLRVLLETFPGIETFDEIVDLSEAVKDTRTSVTQILDSALATLSEFASSVDESEKAFEARSAAFKEEHAGAMQRQTAHKSLVDDLARLRSCRGSGGNFRRWRRFRRPC